MKITNLGKTWENQEDVLRSAESVTQASPTLGKGEKRISGFGFF